MAMNWSVSTIYDDLTVQDWTGRPCSRCAATGEMEDDYGRRACPGCGGTGEEYARVITGPNTEGRIGKGARISGVVR